MRGEGIRFVHVHLASAVPCGERGSSSLISFGAGMLATSGAGPGDAPAALSAHPRSIRSIPHRVSTGDTFEYLRLPSVEELLLQRAGQAAYLPARSRRKGIRPQRG